MLFYIGVVIHEVWALDITVYRKCPMHLNGRFTHCENLGGRYSKNTYKTCWQICMHYWKTKIEHHLSSFIFINWFSKSFQFEWEKLFLVLNRLKTVDTTGYCQRPVFSFGVSQHMHKITNLWKLGFNIGRRSCEIIIEEKTPCSHEVVCFLMLDFVTSNSKSEVSKSNSWKITCLSKTTSLQREPFLTTF